MENNSVTSLNIKYFSNEDQLINYYKNYTSSIWAGTYIIIIKKRIIIIFIIAIIFNQSESTKEWEYTIRINSSYLFNGISIFGKSTINPEKTSSSGFLLLQNSIENSIIKLKMVNKNLTSSFLGSFISIQTFPSK